MEKKEIKKIMPARPKSGKKSFTCSFSLTLEQKQWLLKQSPEAYKKANVSKKVRELIDDIMAMEQRGNLNLSLLASKHAIESLEIERDKIQAEKNLWFRILGENLRRNMLKARPSTISITTYEKMIESYDGWDAMYARDNENPHKHSTKYPIDTPEASFHCKEMLAYDRAIASINERIKELKSKFTEQS